MQTKSLVMIALFTGIIVVLGLIPPIMLTFVPVPIHAQSLGVLLAGVVLGARGGALSVLLPVSYTQAEVALLYSSAQQLDILWASCLQLSLQAGFQIRWHKAQTAVGKLSQAFSLLPQ